MNTKERLRQAEIIYSRPMTKKDKKTPKGQKFSIGQKVRLKIAWGGLCSAGEIVEILYSYRQKYGWMTDEPEEDEMDSYAIKTKHGEGSWLEEDELEEL